MITKGNRMAYKDKSKRPRKGTDAKTVSEWSAILIGKKFGLLTVVKNVGLVNHTQRWECLCDCGKIVNRRTEAFKLRPDALSCGCTRAEISRKGSTKHGMHKTSEYSAYYALKSRCYSKSNPEYKNYGARGITVCDRWLESFENFLKDMGRKPFKSYSIDRVDSSKGYSKENCRWASPTTQSNNTRRNRFLVVDGITATMAEHARRLGVSRTLVKSRLYIGWGVDEAFKAPKVTNPSKCKATGKILLSNKPT
jgi:hypothetical protein